MRAVVQRVQRAAVEIEGQTVAQIEQGLLVLLGVTDGDTSEDVAWLAGKIARLRIFADEAQAMNRSLAEVGGQALVVSQFTLYASTRRGNRPSFIAAARPETAVPLYEAFVEALRQETGREVPTGVFGADMQVSLVNDGPVTILIDSQVRE
ncbi:MAG TPA: D-tyrosyl-tRNA(Tyr) deacylase [Candidatus Rikenella faecigallinarum]|uniref:D-aminoacyl-tRNA deacylase n=1 Tax=Candidatus Rikenella faecigallinarum TaxID=2838745 RepID=A0A9D1QFB9_9BACT|nr:D-tyrosyl-tRNA(Tyr) deacylase [Candidatus Rikenella faecigallinarum]